MRSHNNRKYSVYLSGLISLAIIVVINVIGSYLFKRFDLTDEKRYSLTAATKKKVSTLNDVVFVKVYLEGDLPAGFRKLRNETQEMLDELRIASNKNIEYEFINPYEITDKKARNELFKNLYEKGLIPTDLEVQSEDGFTNKVIWPGAIIYYKDAEVSVQLLKSRIGASEEEMLNNSYEELEYSFAQAIHQISNNQNQRIAFIDGHGELDELETADIIKSLKGSYSVERITINGNLEALKTFNLIVIAKPDSSFSDADKFIIDQFIMKGGRALWLLDGVYTSMDSLQNTSTTMAVAQRYRIEDQLFKYGVRINHDLVMDMRALSIPLRVGTIGNQPKFEFFPWYYQPLLLADHNIHPIVNNLEAVKTEFISSVDTVFAPNVHKTFLYYTSKYSKTVTAPTRVSLNILRVPADERMFTKSFIPVSVLLEGEFESVFANRVYPISDEGKKYVVLNKSFPTKQIIIADGDIIKNGVDREKKRILPLGYDRYTNKDFGNKDFILNCINYLCNDEDLIASRSKEFKIRLLDRQKADNHKLSLQLLNVLLPIFIIVLLGIIQLSIRKYSLKKI